MLFLVLRRAPIALVTCHRISFRLPFSATTAAAACHCPMHYILLRILLVSLLLLLLEYYILWSAGHIASYRLAICNGNVCLCVRLCGYIPDVMTRLVFTWMIFIVFGGDGDYKSSAHFLPCRRIWVEILGVFADHNYISLFAVESSVYIAAPTAHKQRRTHTHSEPVQLMWLVRSPRRPPKSLLIPTSTSTIIPASQPAHLSQSPNIHLYIWYVYFVFPIELYALHLGAETILWD